MFHFLVSFFRYESDGFVFPMYSALHWLLLLLAGGGVFLIYRKRERLRSWTGLRYVLGAGLLLVQLLLYAWFWNGDANLRAAGWPLYHCRIAELAMLLALFGGFRFAKTIAIYLGAYGAIFALLIPIMEPYAFPHVTNLAYFMAHLLMLWTVAFLICVDGYHFDKLGLLQAVVFLNLLNLLILLANPLLGMNYAYFSFSPIFTEFFAAWPRGLYVVFLMLLYNLLLCLTFFLGRRFERRRLEEACVEEGSRGLLR